MEKQMPRLASRSSPAEVLVNFQNTSALMLTQFIQANQSVMMVYLQFGYGMVTSPPYQALAHAPNGLAYYGQASRLVAPPQTTLPQQQANSSLEAKIGTPSNTIPDQKENTLPDSAPTTSEEVQVLPSAPAIDVPANTLDVDQVVEHFVQLVSERTGYPIEMLDPQLDLESDLGIDSIKRVEIISKFRSSLSSEMQQNLENNLEQVAGVRTIQEISEWIRKSHLDLD